MTAKYVCNLNPAFAPTENELQMPLLPPSISAYPKGRDFKVEDLLQFGNGVAEDREPLLPPGSMPRSDDPQASGLPLPPSMNSADYSGDTLPPPIMNIAAYRESIRPQQRTQQRSAAKPANNADDDILRPPVMDFSKRGN